MQDQRTQSKARDIEVWIQESFDLDDWPPTPTNYLLVDMAESAQATAD